MTEEITGRADARLLRKADDREGPCNARTTLNPFATEGGGTSAPF